MLSKLYELRLMEYRLTGKKEQPNCLLAMLLLQHMEEFSAFKGTIEDFYKKHQNKIDEMIQQVIFNFEISDEEIEERIAAKGIYSKNYEHDKVWFVFCEGFGALYWGINHQVPIAPETIYGYCFNERINENSLEKKYRETKKVYEQETYTLPTLYALKLMEYKLTGKKEVPDQLLAMLLLPEKDKFEPLKVSNGEFYKKYQSIIDKMIAKVEKDFDFSQEEIGKMIEEKGIYSENYAHDKIWFVFCEGFGAIHWGQLYHPSATPEEIYSHYFRQNLIYPSFKEQYEKTRRLFDQSIIFQSSEEAVIKKKIS